MMNFKKTIVTFILTSILFIGCKEKLNQTDLNSATGSVEVEVPKIKKEIAPENLQTAHFSIEGMTCAMGCAKTIQNDLTALNGVQEATVDFDTKMATVAFDKAVQTPETLTKVVEAAADGKTYTVKNIKI